MTDHLTKMSQVSCLSQLCCSLAEALRRLFKANDDPQRRVSHAAAREVEDAAHAAREALARFDAAQQASQPVAAPEAAGEQALPPLPDASAWRGANFTTSPDTYAYRDADDRFINSQGEEVGEPLFTADQMHDYARAAQAAQPAPEAAKGVPGGMVSLPAVELLRDVSEAKRHLCQLGFRAPYLDWITQAAGEASNTTPAPEAQQAEQSVIEQLMDERAHIRQAITLLRDFGADLRLLVPDTDSQAVDWEAVRRRFERVMDALAQSRNIRIGTIRRMAREAHAALSKPQPKVPQQLPVRDEREAFEAVARKEGFIDSRMIRVGDGYANRELLRAWRFWQARAALTQPAPEAQQADHDGWWALGGELSKAQADAYIDAAMKASHD